MLFEELENLIRAQIKNINFCERETVTFWLKSKTVEVKC